MDNLRKAQLDASLHEGKLRIENSWFEEDSPLDLSEEFSKLCLACRTGDLKSCQELITDGVNINAHDQFDYTPLILASLCGHYEVVQLLLEAGALCLRDTFQGERCLYNALNNRIRNLLLSYDYSKSTDPLQPFAAHITSLLTRDTPKTSDITVTIAGEVFHLHKFILSSRSPYFLRLLGNTPATMTWKLPSMIPPQAFGIAMKQIYLGEIPVDVGGGLGAGFSDDELLKGIDQISKQLEIKSLWDGRLDWGDRRLARQRRADESEKGRNQLNAWFRGNVLKHKIPTDVARANNVKWDRDNVIFADVLLRADEPEDEPEPEPEPDPSIIKNPVQLKGERDSILKGIPIGPPLQTSRSPSRSRKPGRCVLFPVHRAMLLRSEFFRIMFSSAFREAQTSQYLHIIPIDCSPDVLEVVLTFLYTDKSNIPLDIAIDVLFAADLLLLDRLKMETATVLSTLGNGVLPKKSLQQVATKPEPEDEVINIYEVVRAGWLTRVPRLEEFAARYLAYRLESYIDEPEFAELIQESASQIKGRQDTDSIELLDELRYYLSERFRLRFEDAGLEKMMDENAAVAIGQGKAGSASNREGPHIANHTINSTDTTKAEATDGPRSDGNELLFGELDERNDEEETEGDEFRGDAIKYQVLLGKIDALLERLNLDA